MFEQKSVHDTLAQVQSNQDNGLSEREVQERLQKYGKNELVEGRHKTILEAFLEQLNDPLIFVLFVAVIISMLLHEVSDALIIVSVIMVNAVVGVIQEGKAQKALDSLKRLASPKAVVKREGKQREIPAEELVVGDIVCLDAGRQIPADLRLLETAGLKVEESALTGESLPIQKEASFLARTEIPVGDRKNMAFMSTSVSGGRGCGVVIATGMQTEIGKIAAMINETKQEITPLQKRLADLGKVLSAAAVILCLALFGIAVIQKRNIIEMLITAISLAVAAVPEGLPAVVTIVLALSVSKMVKVNTIVRKLPSVETLGAVSVVCSDKTGTLTQNKMSVTRCYIGQRFLERGELREQEHREFLEGMVLCSDAVISGENRIGDPTELALLELAQSCHIKRTEVEKRLPRVGEIAFDSDRKMMTTLHRGSTGYVSYTKGAADEILKRCRTILSGHRSIPITEVHRHQIQNAVKEMSSQALRVLAVAMKKDSPVPSEQDLTFIGLAGMIDPPREEAAAAVKKFKEASVDTVMITGDHIETAFAIGKELGIVETITECMTGSQLQKLSGEELKTKLKGIHVFARVSPEHKVKIVRALKDSGKIVAMTGDGVNDAPSLKAADIGIAMGMTGTDVAKNASDIILTDDNFATIEKAIEEGRGIYENIKKSVLFLLSSNFGEIIIMFTAILLGLPAPLKASHILWINLITDSLPALALGVDENDRKSLMKRPPRKAKESLFAHGGLACTLFYGTLIAAISLTAFLAIPYSILNARNLPFTYESMIAVLSNQSVLYRSQTYAFIVLCLSEVFHAIGMRDIRKSVFCMNHLENKLMLAAAVIGFLLQIAVTEVPYLVAAFGTTKISIKEWCLLAGLAAFPLLAHEIMVFTALFVPAKGENKQKKKEIWNFGSGV